MAMPITTLLNTGHVDRRLRAYAYLTASFQGRGTTHDALDCLLPFVVAGLEAQQGNTLDLNLLSQYVARLGLSIPVYVLEQLRPRLVTGSHIAWDRSSRSYLVLQQTSVAEEIAEDPQIRNAFDSIEARFTIFAERHGLNKPPVSPSWSDAIIGFLKSEIAGDAVRSIDVKGALIGDASQIESYIVALFIRHSEQGDQVLFNNIVTVFTGVLIEDFIDNIQIISAPETFSRLSIYYDTTVILRLLGTSGHLLQSATVEMHRALQDLGCKTYYFDFVESETLNVLEALISAYDSGQSIYNETAEAIYSGEINIGMIRDILGTFSVRLGGLNIFPFEYKFSSRKNEDTFQIDESDFVDMLTSAAKMKDRTYKESNAITDAKSVAIVLRLRRGSARREVSAAGHLFISRNTLLQKTSRKFSIEKVESYDKISIPPILTVGQITTIAWLSSTHKLEPKKVSKELLAACYNAVRPSAGWADEFSKALSRFKQENPSFAIERANQHFFLQTARIMARDESLGQAAVLRKLHLAEIFENAARDAEQHEVAQQQRIAQLEARIKELESNPSQKQNGE